MKLTYPLDRPYKMKTHEIRFYRNPADGMYRAICSCGWTLEGDREDVQAKAATHDLDEENDQ